MLLIYSLDKQNQQTIECVIFNNSVQIFPTRTGQRESCIGHHANAWRHRATTIDGQLVDLYDHGRSASGNASRRRGRQIKLDLPHQIARIVGEHQRLDVQFGCSVCALRLRTAWIVRIPHDLRIVGRQHPGIVELEPVFKSEELVASARAAAVDDQDRVGVDGLEASVCLTCSR